MAQLLPEAPNFGTQLARGLGAGFSKGVSDSREIANKLALQKAQYQQILELAGHNPQGAPQPGSPAPHISPQEMESTFLEALPQLEQVLGRELRGEERDTIWNKLRGTSQSAQEAKPEQDAPDEGMDLALDILAPEVGRGKREREKLKRKQFESERAFHSARSEKILEKADEARENLRKQETSLKSLEDAISNMPEGFSLDYLADLTGYEPFRTAKGAQFKTATKEFLLSNITRAGNRPNMWIEQQIGDMMAKIGRSREANETFVATKKADLEVERKKLDLLGTLEDQYMQTLGYVPKNIAREVDSAIRPYAQSIENGLAYRLREIHEREGGAKTIAKIHKVPPGTPLTLEKASAIEDESPGKNSAERKENALKIAKKLGYKIMSDEFYRSLL